MKLSIVATRAQSDITHCVKVFRFSSLLGASVAVQTDCTTTVWCPARGEVWMLSQGMLGHVILRYQFVNMRSMNRPRKWYCPLVFPKEVSDHPLLILAVTDGGTLMLLGVWVVGVQHSYVNQVKECLVVPLDTHLYAVDRAYHHVGLVGGLILVS